MGGRGELLAAVSARIERVDTLQDLSPTREPGALLEAQRLSALLRDGSDDLEARYLLGLLHWYRFQALPVGQDSQDLNATISVLTPCFLAGAADGTPDRASR